MVPHPRLDGRQQDMGEPGQGEQCGRFGANAEPGGHISPGGLKGIRTPEMHRHQRNLEGQADEETHQGGNRQRRDTLHGQPQHDLLPSNVRSRVEQRMP
jgi:hypothetical protein